MKTALKLNLQYCFNILISDETLHEKEEISLYNVFNICTCNFVYLAIYLSIYISVYIRYLYLSVYIFYLSINIYHFNILGWNAVKINEKMKHRFLSDISFLLNKHLIIMCLIYIFDSDFVEQMQLMIDY